MSDLEATSWVRLTDLSESSIWISAVNTTTQSPIPEDARIEFTGITERGLTLTLPIRSCAFGHFLSIRIRKTQKPLRKSPPLSEDPKAVPIEEISFTAKITEEQPLNEVSKSVTLTLFQVDENQWKRLLADIEENQNRVNRIVSNIRE